MENTYFEKKKNVTYFPRFPFNKWMESPFFLSENNAKMSVSVLSDRNHSDLKKDVSDK